MSKNLSIEDSARTFALLGMAVADAGITAWETKNTYDFWRPESAIQLAGANGLDPSDADPTWRPLLTTPNHQSYTSGHSTFSAAAATVLALLFGDDQTFTVAGDGRVREYSSLWAAAQDAGMSRIYGGIHWQFDNQAGLSSGSAIGAWVVNTALIPSPSAAGIMALGGMMVMRRRRK
jgi:membrane-associated phospholipid phosphatase